MTNVLVTVRFTVDVSEERVEGLVGRPDDSSDDWYSDAYQAAQDWVADNLPVALESTTGEPEVEAD